MENDAADPAQLTPSDPNAAPVWRERLRNPFVLATGAVVIVVVVGLVVTGAFSSSSSTAQSASTQVVAVTKGDLSNEVSAQGTVAAAQTDDLNFSAAGTVTAVNVKAGDKVTAGQVLATMDSAALAADASSAASTLAEAEAQLSDDQSSGASSDQISADETSVASGNDSLASAWKALAGASLVATFDGTVSAVNVTVGEQLASSGTGGTGMTGSNSGSGNAPSPSSSNGSSSNGSSSDASSTDDVQVVSKGSYIVKLSVGSSDVDTVKAGQVATLTVSSASSSSGRFPGGGAFPAGAFPGGNGGQSGTGTQGNGSNGNRSSGGGAATTGGATATGKVTEVARVATTSSGVAQYPVTIVFTAGSDEFYIGSTVNGSVATTTRKNVLQVSVRAVTTDANGKSSVTVRSNGNDEKRTVTTGITANGMVEITKGLKAGEKVVISLPAGLPTGRPTGSNGAPGGLTFNPSSGSGQ